MSRHLLACLLLLVFAASSRADEPSRNSEDGAEDSSPPAGAISIDCDYPGGNIVVEGIENNVVTLRPDLRHTAGWWFYWNFRVRGAAGRDLRFQFAGGKPVGVRGPAVSEDGGESWSWLGAESGDSGSFRYRFAQQVREVRFAFAVPYLQADWAKFLQRHKDAGQLRPDVLCKSRHGRDVECLVFGSRSTQPRAHVLLTCRHHACESLASYVLEGLIDTIVAAETKQTAWLAEHVCFMAVPFVDKDGVEEGDQGKNRRPRDHNRDYAGESLYPETRTIRERVPDWSEDRPLVTIDLHCPWIRGTHNEEIYIVGSSVESIWDEQQRLGAILERVCTGPLPYRAASNLPFGTAWNTAGNYTAGKSNSRWAGSLPNVRLAASFEIPYANAGGAAVTADSARAFGRDLAIALAEYLHEEDDR